MLIRYSILIVAALIVDRIFQKRFPRFYKRIELPLIILFSLIATVYCGCLIYGVYDVLTSGVSNGDKVFFTVFIGIIISVYVTMVILTWLRWLKERKGKK